MVRRDLKFYLGLIISLVILVVLFRKIPISEVLFHLKKTKPLYLIIAFFLYFIEFLIPAVRFYYIGKENGIRISFKSSYTAVFIGALGNYTLPARAGEIVKTLYLERANPQEGYGKTKAFGMLFWERALDFIVVFFLLLAMLNFYGVMGENRSALISLVIVCSGLILALLFLMTGEKITIRVIDLIWVKNKKIREYSKYIFSLFSEYKNFRFILSQCLLTCLYWFVVLIGYFLIFLSSGIQLSLFEAMLFLSIGTMGIAIPAGPGSVGVIQGAFVLAGGIVGIQSDLALAIGIVYQAVQILFSYSMGLCFSGKILKELF